jgi:hypothetical protein
MKTSSRTGNVQLCKLSVWNVYTYEISLNSMDTKREGDITALECGILEHAGAALTGSGLVSLLPLWGMSICWRVATFGRWIHLLDSM